MKGLTIKMNQAEDRISGFEYKIEDLDQISKEHEKIKVIGKESTGNIGHQKKANL